MSEGKLAHLIPCLYEFLLQTSIENYYCFCYLVELKKEYEIILSCVVICPFCFIDVN